MPTLLREPATQIEPPLQRESATNGPDVDDSGAPQAIPDQSSSNPEVVPASMDTEDPMDPTPERSTHSDAQGGPVTRAQAEPRRSTRDRRPPTIFNPSAAYTDWTPQSIPQVPKARKTADPDTLTWDEAMISPHKEEFFEAAQREMDELASKGTWYEDHKSNATTKIEPTKWVF